MKNLKFKKTELTPSEPKKWQEALSIVFGLLIILAFPLLFVLGLMLLGLPVTVSFASWGGASLVSLFLVLVNRFANFNTK